MNPYREAMKVLEGHWIKGMQFSGDNVCGIGAIATVTGLKDYVYISSYYLPTQDAEKRAELRKETAALNRRMANKAHELFPDRIEKNDSFPYFNDHDLTTEADVLLVMEKAAIEWDEHNGQED